MSSVDPFPISLRSLPVPMVELGEEAMDLDEPADDRDPSSPHPVDADFLRLQSLMLGLDRGASFKKLEADERLEALFCDAIKQKPEDQEVADQMVHFATRLYEEHALPSWIQESLQSSSASSETALQENPGLIFSLVKKGRLDRLREVTSSDPAFWLSLRAHRGNTALHVALQEGKQDVALWLAKRCPSLLTATNNHNEQPLDLYKKRGEEPEFLEKLTQSSSPWECVAELCHLQNTSTLEQYVQSRSAVFVQTSLAELGKLPPKKIPLSSVRHWARNN